MRININGTWRSITKGVINIGGTWRSISKGVINISGIWRSIWSAGGPSQLTRPTLSGTGAARSNVTRSSGTYNNELSITSKILKTTFEIPNDGLTTAPDGLLITNNPYTVTQYDAAVIAYTLYAVDIVTGQDGQDYYYYSLPKQTYIPSLSDSFNRANSGSLGTMSSGFIYDSDSNWGVSSLTAYNGGSPNYNRAVLSVGETDVSLSASIPDGKGGVGLTFWGTAGASYWAAFPSYSYEEIPNYPIHACLPPGVSTTECPVIAEGGNGPLGYYLESQLGQRCSQCIPTTVTTFKCPDTYNQTNTAAQGCPDPDGNPTTSAGRVCGGGCFTNYYYPCTGPRVYKDEDCTLRAGDNEFAGDKCNCSEPYIWDKPSCTQLSSSNEVNCPNTGPNLGDRCSGTCTKDCSVSVSNSLNCPGSGEAPGQRCSDCIPSTSIQPECSKAEYCYTQNCCTNLTKNGDTPNRCSDCTDLTTSETVYDYSYRASTATTTYPCSGTATCSGQNCCDSITLKADPTGAGQACGSCTQSTSTSTSYSYPIRSSTGTTTYSCNGATRTGQSSCPSMPADYTGSGQRCSACTPSTNTTYGSCKTPGSNDPSGCIRNPSGYVACATGQVRCPSSTTTYSYQVTGAGTTTYLCNSTFTGSGDCPTTLPTLGTGAGARCGSCTTTNTTTYTGTYGVSQTSSSYLCSFSASSASCPDNFGTGAGQRCTSCTARTVTNYAYLYIRNQDITVTKYSYTKNSPWYFNVRNTVPTTVYDHNTKVQEVLSYDYKTSIIDTTSTTNVYNVVTESTTTAYNHKTRLRIANSGSVVSESSLSGAEDYLSSSYNESLYNRVYGISVSTSGNQISVVAYADTGLNSSIGGASYSSSGTKGTYVGIIKGPSADLIGNNLDNLSYTRITSV